MINIESEECVLVAIRKLFLRQSNGFLVVRRALRDLFLLLLDSGHGSLE